MFREKQFNLFLLIFFVGVALITIFVFKAKIVEGFNQEKLYANELLLKRAMNGDADAVRQMLLSGVDPNTSPGASDKGMTALMFASWRGHTDIVKMLVKAGARINSISDSGATALMFAAQGGHMETAKILVVEGKANTDIYASNGETALSIAVSRGHFNTVELLAGRGNARNIPTTGNLTSTLMRAILREDMQVINSLLKANPNLEVKDKFGRSALIYAVERGNIGIVTVLLNRGADPNTIDNKGISVLRYAKVLKHKQIFELLQTKGAHT